MESITAFVLEAVASPWLYPLIFVLILCDAFLVLLPSETVVVALGALAVSTGHPNPGFLIATAATAAITGDSLIFLVGRQFRVPRLAWRRRPRIMSVLGWAARALEQRAAVVLLTARFIPFGRIAVNLTAGATGFRYRRFAALTALAGVGWSLYNVAVGVLFGRMFGGNPLVAVAVSVVVAVGVGASIDIAAGWCVRRRRAGPHPDVVSRRATP